MKKLLFSFIAALALVCCFTSCETVGSGDILYEVTLSESSTELSMNFDAFYYGKVADALVNAGFTMPFEDSRVFYMNGMEKSCDKKFKSVMNKAMDSIEGESDYNKVIQMSGAVLQGYRIDDDDKETLVFERTFK